MLPINIKIVPGAREPLYKSTGSAGADIFAFLDRPVTLAPMATTLIPTGLFMEIPHGYEAQIRPRSGLALEHGLAVLNSPGTIDSDYRGEIKIIITNFGARDFIIENGMRIAQVVFSKVYRGKFIQVTTLNETDRNEGGFGHTGI